MQRALNELPNYTCEIDLLECALNDGRIAFGDPATAARDRAGEWCGTEHRMRAWNDVQRTSIELGVGLVAFRALLERLIAHKHPGLPADAVDRQRAHWRAVIAHVIDSTEWCQYRCAL